MALANRVLGKDAYLSFKGVEVTADFRSLAFNRTTDTVDKTAGSEPDKSYIASLKDGTMELTLTWVGGTADQAYVDNLINGAEGTLLWGIKGTTAGYPKGGAYGIVNSVSDTVPYNDLVTRTIGFQKSGTMLFDDEQDTW